MVKVILDTGVFFRRRALAQLREVHVPVVVPATVYMERGRQLRVRGISAEAWDAVLQGYGFVVQPFGRVQAARFAMQIQSERLWRRIYRDAIIAGHVGPGDVLWTTNPKDFLSVGLDAHQVVGV